MERSLINFFQFFRFFFYDYLRIFIYATQVASRLVLCESTFLIFQVLVDSKILCNFQSLDIFVFENEKIFKGEIKCFGDQYSSISSII